MNPDAPNVVLIVSDDLNADLGAYGDQTARTPRIDQLAAEGIMFRAAYAQASLCNPSRTSMLTGLYPDQIGIRHNRDGRFRDKHPDIETLPQWFRTNGYHTLSVGKIFHAAVPDSIGKKSKYDDPDSWDESLYPSGIDRVRVSDIYSQIPGQFGDTLSWLAIDAPDEAFTDGQVAKAALSALAKQVESEPERPFFLAVGFYLPHTPFVAPQRYFDMHPLTAVEPVISPADDSDDIPPAALGLRLEWANMTLTQRAKATQAYHAAVSYMDSQVGVLLDGLDKLGLSQNTVVVFLSDNGHQLGNHGLWHKGDLFEESSRVPLIVRYPDMRTAGAQTDAIVELVDLYPTLLELAGLPGPGHQLSGSSIVPILKDPTSTGKPAALTVGASAEPAPETAARLLWGYSIRTPVFRYTEWDDGRLGVEIYDHEDDPLERHNMAGYRRGPATAAEPDNGCAAAGTDSPSVSIVGQGGDAPDCSERVLKFQDTREKLKQLLAHARARAAE